MPDQLPGVGPVGDLPERANLIAWLVELGVTADGAARSIDHFIAAIRAHIADQQQAVVDRELDRYDPADNYGEAMEHSLVADISRKLIAVTRGGSDA